MSALKSHSQADDRSSVCALLTCFNGADVGAAGLRVLNVQV